MQSAARISSVLLALLSIAFVTGQQDKCIRRLYEAKGERRLGANGFAIEIAALTNTSDTAPDGFVPGETYLVTLRGWRTAYTVQTFRGFGISSLFEADSTPAGKWELPGGKRGEARISPNCRSAGVSHSNLRPKTSVHVQWRAPETAPPGSCVLFQAAVIESKYVWYLDDETLTRKFCIRTDYQKLVPDDSSSTQCCACDEAKYELEFVGLWSKETHPKDYPSLLHLTHFTDMLGASHSSNYSLWKFGDLSTDGMKEIAEWGNTYKAEQEAKAKASEVRTLMKVKGLWYPEVQGRTKSQFVVNKYHHFVSLACMFGPSPDWCVGVSSINLCLADCSWVSERTFDLLPWDAGTDDGPTYMSPNQPAEPRHPIVAITTQGDRRSPFYNDQSSVIPPLAKLILRRTDVVSAQCRTDAQYKSEAHNITNTSEDEEYKDRRECGMSDWSQWSLCSATCGKGIRMRSRVFTFPVKAQFFHCHRQTTERQFCAAKIPECENSDAFNSRCAVGGWAEWSNCSVQCGFGVRERTRQFLDETIANSTGTCAVELIKRDVCVGEDGEDCSVKPNPHCKTTSWSEFSPCSASCDEGQRIRTRLLHFAEYDEECAHVKLVERDSCVLQSCRRLLNLLSEEICQEEKAEGQCNGQFPRYWHNANTSRCERFIYTGCKGNRNQFETEHECRQLCEPGYEANRANVPNHQLVAEFGASPDMDDGGERVDCWMNEWQSWSSCSETCGGNAKRTRTRTIRKFPRNGGMACPEHLTQELRCHLRPCPLNEPMGCLVGPWSGWTTCSAIPCGQGEQMRRRRVHDRDEYGESCGLVSDERRNCFVACPP